ncbi:unnamed protein product [Durusdinium trenchii]|uniref:Uncharacterized protein n=2 Tax=Durusdinium trenchii TaxID=1381693 RepID=A0ABP0NHE5_9DINO
MRQTLQKAQEITQVISEAESIAEDATKFCEAIQAQHLVQSKKLALTGKPQATAATACVFVAPATPATPCRAGVDDSSKKLSSRW